MPLKVLLQLLVFSSILFTAAAQSTPISLQAPTAYDNAGGGVTYGQTFVAESTQLLGVRWYIGQPGLESDPLKGSLDGLADIVLFDLFTGPNPVEIARSTVQGTSDQTSGLSAFNFDVVVTTIVGSQYFIGLETSDTFGLGLGQRLFSTYEGGYEARLNGVLLEYAGGGGAAVDARFRDTSFEILTKTSDVPAPGTWALFTLGLIMLSLSRGKVG